MGLRSRLHGTFLFPVGLAAIGSLVVGHLAACSTSAGSTAHDTTPFPATTSSSPDITAFLEPVATPDREGTTPSCDALTIELPELIVAGEDVEVPPIEDGSHDPHDPHDSRDPHEQGVGSLASLYEKLARLARGKATDHVRIAMYGDSNLTADHVSGELRRTLQKRWGDGGHGFHALSRPWPGYVHHDVRVGSEGWKGFNCTTDQLLDRMYGFGCIAAQSHSGGARTWIASAPADAPVGRSFSRFEVAYLHKPQTRGFDVLVDGVAKGTVDTNGIGGMGGMGGLGGMGDTAPEVGFHRVEVAEGPHRVEIVSRSMDVRLLGAIVESAVPGVVVDALGVGGADTEHLVRSDERVSDLTLRRRGYDLVILFTGAIEPDSPAHAIALRHFVDRHRTSLPGVPILITGPVDMASGTVEKPTSNPRIDHVLSEKRRVARENAAAFWDFRAAMGGPLSIVRFSGKQMAWSDFIHLTEKGGTYMGRRLAYALVQGMRAYLASHPRAGC